MCFKKWFCKPDPIEPPITEVKRRLLSFAINNYSGTANDLNGCLNDQENIASKLLTLFPDFDVRKFKDSEVTVNCYKTEVAKAISVLSPGATVLILPDSCFSGTITRKPGMGLVEEKHPSKNRFFDPGLPPRKKVGVKLFIKSNIRWIVISGCQEHQTSADAYINEKYNGAFTFYAALTLKAGITYKEWFTEIRKYLPNSSFDQSPTLEGPEELLNRKVFEDETLVVHNSSHGTYTYDKNGDEEDGQDEALYLYDGMLIDDAIGTILDKIK